MNNKTVLIMAVMILAGFPAFAQTKTDVSIIDAGKVNAKFVTPFINQSLQKEAITICEDEKLSQAKWKTVAARVKDKRIILLGEFNHGSKEIFQIRNDLIKFLHQKIGASVILFESGIGELAFVELDRAGMSPAQMTNGFFGNWRTKEFQSLMEFNKANNISIAGFDVQRSGNSFNNLLKRVGASKNIDTILYFNLEENYGLAQRQLTNKKAVYDSLKQKTSDLINGYRSIYNMLLKDSIAVNTKELMFTLQTIKNRIGYLSYMLQFVHDHDFKKRFKARDSTMAENIIWLAENIYKQEKIIVIAHNYHIAKHNEYGQVMGEILSKKYGKGMYAIGIFAGAGTYTGNSGEVEKMSPADTVALDIKHIISQLSGSVSFINIPKQRRAENTWLNENIIVNDSFTDLNGTNKLVLSKLFDGLLLLHKVSPPQKIE
jgi:erythromycin esterase